MSSKRPFVVNATLTAIAIGYSNPAQTLIADRVLPRVPVGGEKFKWMEYPVGEAFSVPDTHVGRTGRVNQVEFTGTEKTDSVEDYGLEDPIPNSDITEAARMRAENQGTFDPVNFATMNLTNLTMLDREVRCAAKVQDPNSYAANRKITLTTGDFLNDPDSDAIDILQTAINGTLIYRGNKLVMGQKVWQSVSTHPALVNAIRGNLTNKGIVSREELARLLEIKEILVGEGYVNLAKKGQPVNLQRVWGNSIQAIFSDETARPEGGMTFGFTAEYGNRVAGTIDDEDVGLHGGVRVRVGERVKEMLPAKDLGYQINNAISE